MILRHTEIYKPQLMMSKRWAALKSHRSTKYFPSDSLRHFCFPLCLLSPSVFGRWGRGTFGRWTGGSSWPISFEEGLADKGWNHCILLVWYFCQGINKCLVTIRSCATKDSVPLSQTKLIIPALVPWILKREYVSAYLIELRNLAHKW